MSSRLALMSLSAALALGLAAPTLVAAKADPVQEAKRLEAATANAGEPVERVRFLRPIDSYEVVGEQHVLIWETQQKAWLVDLRKSAACRDLDRGITVGIENNHDTISTKNAYIVGEYGVRCKIMQLREVDVPAMRRMERGEVATAE
ncbi:DUF6491 family protein [Arenimonas sp. MALMAid1274]|uniref:DUF6491 family protein n=1 Tax=Arenimonas sp. MALMAid1274 TaxID=3411630 RepID=UPI003B9E3967